MGTTTQTLVCVKPCKELYWVIGSFRYAATVWLWRHYNTGSSRKGRYHAGDGLRHERLGKYDFFVRRSLMIRTVTTPWGQGWKKEQLHTKY